MAHHAGADVGFYSISIINSIPPPGRDVVHRSLSSSIDFGGTVEPRRVYDPKVKITESFYYFEDPVNATTSLLPTGFYDPTVVDLRGFHCTYKIFCKKLSLILPKINYLQILSQCRPSPYSAINVKQSQSRFSFQYFVFFLARFSAVIWQIKVYIFSLNFKGLNK